MWVVDVAGVFDVVVDEGNDGPWTTRLLFVVVAGVGALVLLLLLVLTAGSALTFTADRSTRIHIESKCRLGWNTDGSIASYQCLLL